jgi:hypothetical protein
MFVTTADGTSRLPIQLGAATAVAQPDEFNFFPAPRQTQRSPIARVEEQGEKSAETRKCEL